MSEHGSVTVARLARRMGIQAALLAAMLFGPAGTLAWPRGWALIAAAMLCVGAIYAWLWRHDMALLEERLRGPIQKDQSVEDRRVNALLLLAGVAWFVFLPVDVFHLRLLPPPPAALGWLGMALLLAGAGAIFLTFRENSFASPVVKHQGAGQRVVDSGPYAYVRHPMYSGMLLVAAGVPLWLQSLAGLAAAALPAAVLAWRIAIEERHLRASLEGYDAYTRRVRARLVPYLW